MGQYDTRTPHTSTLWVLRHCNPYTGRGRDAFLRCTRDWRTSGADHIFHHNDIRTFVHKHQTPSRPDKFLNIWHITLVQELYEFVQPKAWKYSRWLSAYITTRHLREWVPRGSGWRLGNTLLILPNYKGVNWLVRPQSSRLVIHLKPKA